MKVLLGVINKLDKLNVTNTFKEKLISLTDFWIFNATQNSNLVLSIEYFTSEQECLDYANRENFNIVIGSAVGHLLRPGNAQEKNVILETIKLCNKSDGLIGHIMAHPGRIPYFYDEFWAVNLNIYRDVGEPKWELEDTVNFPSFDRHSENFHSDYTPYSIKGLSPGSSMLQNRGGTGLIKAWLEEGKEILNFPRYIRKLKHHLYPEHSKYLDKYLNNECGVEELQQELQLEYFSSVDYEHAKKCIFLFNTDSIKFNTPNKPIDTLISVCAAFRPYLILHKSGFTQNTTVKFIDYSDISLQFKKWLVNNWDGKDILSAVSLFEKCTDTDILWNKPFNLSFEQAYKQVIDEFGGIDSWLIFWKQYKELKHEFHLVDLVEDTDKVISLLGKKQNYLYISNSFNTEAGIIKHGRTKLLGKLKRIVEIGLESNIILDGSDLNHCYPSPDYTQNLLKYYKLN